MPIPTLPKFPDLTLPTVPNPADIIKDLVGEVAAKMPDLGFIKEFIPDNLPCSGIIGVLEDQIKKGEDSLKSTLPTSLGTFGLTALQDALTALTGEASLLSQLLVSNMVNQIVGPLQGFTSLMVLLLNADNIAKYTIATMLQEQLRDAVTENTGILGEILDIVDEITQVIKELDGRFDNPYDENLMLLDNAKNEVDEAVIELSYAEEFLKNVKKLSSRYLVNAQIHIDGSTGYLTSGAFSDIESRITKIQKANPDLSYDKAFKQAVEEYRLDDLTQTDEAKFWESIALSITAGYSDLAKIIPLENLGDDWAIGELFNKGTKISIKDLEKKKKTLIESNGLVKYTTSAIQKFDVDWSHVRDLSNNKYMVSPITNQRKALQAISNNMKSYLDQKRGSSDPMLSASFIGWTAALEIIKQSISIIVPASEVEDELQNSADAFSNLQTFLDENPNDALDLIVPDLIRATVSLLQIIYNPQLTKQALASFNSVSLTIKLAADWNFRLLAHLDTLNFDVFTNALTSANANLVKKIIGSDLFGDTLGKLDVAKFTALANSILSAPAGLVWGISFLKDLGENLFGCIGPEKDPVLAESSVEILREKSSVSDGVSADLAKKAVDAQTETINKQIAGIEELIA